MIINQDVVVNSVRVAQNQYFYCCKLLRSKNLTSGNSCAQMTTTNVAIL